jgi:hypothetical protein
LRLIDFAASSHYQRRRHLDGQLLGLAPER